MSPDLLSLPSSLIRAVGYFCEPRELCLLSTTCRSLHQDLGIWIHTPTLLNLDRTESLSGCVQQILQLPLSFYNLTHFVHLRVQIHEKVRFCIVSQPGTGDRTKRIRDEQGNEGTIVKRFDLATDSTTTANVDLFVEPDQQYFLWAVCDDHSTPNVDVRCERERIMVWDDPTFSIKKTCTIFEELNQTCNKEGWESFAKRDIKWSMFFIKMLALALEASWASPILAYFHLPMKELVDEDKFRTLKIFKIFLNVLVQLIRQEPIMDCIVKPCPPQEFLFEKRHDFTLPPLHFHGNFGTARNKKGPEDIDKIIVSPCTTSIGLSQLLQERHDAFVSRAIKSISHLEFQYTRDKELGLRYTFRPYAINKSCKICIEQVGYSETSSYDLELMLSVVDDCSDVSRFFLLMMKQCRPTIDFNPYGPPSSMNNLCSLLQMFLATVAIALLKCASPSCKALSKFLEEEGYYIPSQTESIPIFYKFDLDPSIATCHVHVHVSYMLQRSEDRLAGRDVILQDDGSDIAGMLLRLMRQCLANTICQKGQSSSISSLSVLFYSFLRSLTCILMECKGPGYKALARILEEERFVTTQHGLEALRLGPNHHLEDNDIKIEEEIFFACYDNDVDPNFALCYVSIQPSKTMIGSLVSLIIDETENVSSLLLILMQWFRERFGDEPFSAYRYARGSYRKRSFIFGLLQTVAQVLMECKDPSVVDLADFLRREGFSTAPLALQLLIHHDP